MFEAELGKFLLTAFGRALIAFFGTVVYPWLKGLRRSLRLKKEGEAIDFMTRFLGEGIANREPLLVEHAFRAYFKKSADYQVILKLISAPNPTAAFHYYFQCKEYVDFDRKSKNFCYRKNYKTKKKRALTRIKYSVFYAIPAFLGIWLLMFSSEIVSFGGLGVIPSLAVLVLLAICVAIVSLGEVFNIGAADKLLAEFDM